MRNHVIDNSSILALQIKACAAERAFIKAREAKKETARVLAKAAEARALLQGKAEEVKGRTREQAIAAGLIKAK